MLRAKFKVTRYQVNYLQVIVELQTIWTVEWQSNLNSNSL